MSKGRALLAGVSWMYASQIATVVVQMAYAAVTSRLIGPEGFASYAVALAVGALALLLANGGLGQSVGRMEVLDPESVRPLSAYSACLGLGGAATLYFTAPLWAGLWGNPGADGPLRVLSLAVLVAPMAGLAAGLLRRQGRFRFVALSVFICNTVGMAVGVAAVYLWRNAEALLVANIFAQLLTLGVFVFMNMTLLFGVFRLTSSLDQLRFSWKLTAVSMVAYLNGNIGKLVVSNFLPRGALGHWNRADVVTTVPFMQVQNAIIQGIYAEFRHDVKNALRARVIWGDLLTLVGWLALPAAAVASVVIPKVTQMLFGPGWEQASALSGPLALVGGLQILTTVLASAVEALGKFQWMWATQLSLLIVYAAAAVWCVFTQEWYAIIAGLFVGQVVQHALHIFFCAREGYLAPLLLLRKYAQIIAASIALWVLTQLGMMGFRASAPWWVLAVEVIAVLLACGLLWKLRSRLEPVRIALKYRNR